MQRAALFLATATAFVGLATAAAAEPTERFVAYAVESGPGQVWRVGLDGSGARRLTTGETADVSPDGRHIAFIRDSRIYVMNARGGAITLLHRFGFTNGGRDAPRVLWAPDSRRLVVEDGDATIALVDTQTGRTRRLVHVSTGCCVSFTSFAPHGCTLAYVVWGPKTHLNPFTVRTVRCDGTGGHTVGTTSGGAAWGNAGIAVYGRNGIRLIRPDGSSRSLTRALLTPKAFSSDGRMLLAVGGGTLLIIDVATGDIRTVKSGGSVLAISHDGASVLVLVGCSQDSVPSGTLRVLAVDTGAAREIVDEDVAHGRYGACRASWNA